MSHCKHSDTKAQGVYTEPCKRRFTLQELRHPTSRLLDIIRLRALVLDMNHNCIENMTLNGASGLSQVKTVSRASTHTYSMTRVNDGQWIDSFFYFAMFLNLSCRLLADGRPNLAPIVANIPASGLCRLCRYFDTMNSGWTETWAHWSRGLIASHQSNVRGDCKALKAITMLSGYIWFVCAGKILLL